LPSVGLDYYFSLIFSEQATWDAVTLANMGDLLISLNEAQQMNIRIETLFYSLSVLLGASQFNRHYQVSPINSTETSVAMVRFCLYTLLRAR
jgi:hypothetical protein